MNIINKLNEKQKSPLIKPCGNIDDTTINKEYLIFLVAGTFRSIYEVNGPSDVYHVA